MKRLALGVLVVVLWAMAAPAQAGVWSAPQDVGVPVNSMSVGPDSCIAESVTFNGNFVLEITTMVDANGQTHIRSIVPMINVSATGSAGGQYKLMVVSKMVETISETNIGIEATQIWRFLLQGQGPTNNETFYMTVHITNPNPQSQSTGVNINRLGSRCSG